MIPEKFREDVRTAEKRVERAYITVFLVFLVAGFLLGPIIHEIAHIAVLESFRCGYVSSWSLGVHGSHAEIAPRCFLEPQKLLVFYSAGHVATFLAGASLGLLSLGERGIKRTVAGSTGAGLLFSVAVVSMREGDTSSLAHLLGLPEIYSRFLSLTIFLTVSAVAVYVMENTVDSSER